MSTFSVIGLGLLFLYGVLGYKKPGIAFVTAPVVAVALGCIAVRTDSPEGALLAPVLYVVALISVAVSACNFDSKEWYHRAAIALLVCLVVLLVLGIFLVEFHVRGVAGILIVLFLAAAILIVVSSLSYGMTSRRVAAMNVFSTLGASMRQNLPLPMALDCASYGRRDATGRILQRIKTWMVKGYSLSEAVGRGYPQCPSRALALLSAGERIDQLPAAMGAVEADAKSRLMEHMKLRPVHPAYPVVMLIILFIITTGLLRFVVPQLKFVLQEVVEGELPAAMRTLIGVVDSLTTGPWLLLLVLGAMTFLGLWVYGAWRRRRLDKPYFLSRLGDYIRWHLPIVHWFQRNLAMVQVVELLRMSLNAGCPVNEAIRGTLQLDVNLCFRNRLACWLRRVERGGAIGDSARACGLGNALAWAFDGGVETGNTPAVLEMLEAHYRSHYSYRVNLARLILWPVGIIMLGVTVGFVIFAIYSSLVAVLMQLTANVYP